MFLPLINNDMFIYLFIFLLQVWAMKFAESTNLWYIIIRVTCTIKLNIKETLMGNKGFLQCLCSNVHVMKGLQSENSGPVT